MPAELILKEHVNTVVWLFGSSEGCRYWNLTLDLF